MINNDKIKLSPKDADCHPPKNIGISGKTCKENETAFDTKKEEKDTLDKIVDLVFIGSDVAREIVASGDIAKTLSVSKHIIRAADIGNVVAGAYLGIKGIVDLKQAIKKKDVEVGVEAVGELALGGGATIKASGILAEAAAALGVGGPIASALMASPALSVASVALGSVYGATEIISGSKDIYQGIKEKNKKKLLSGLLDCAIGVGAIALCAVGGAPIAIGLAGAYLTRMFVFDADKFKSAFRKLREK